MMVDVDALTWRFGHIISHCIDISDILSSHNRAKCPLAYTATECSDLGKFNIIETENPSSDPPPFFTSDTFHHFSHYITIN